MLKSACRLPQILFTVDSLQFKKDLEVVYNMGVLKHYAHWDIFWSGGIEIFYPWDIFWSGSIEIFAFWGYWNSLSQKFIKILNYIKSLSIIFYTKLFKIFWNILIKKVRQENSCTILCSNMFQYPHIVCNRRTLLQTLSKN